MNPIENTEMVKMSLLVQVRYRVKHPIQIHLAGLRTNIIIILVTLKRPNSKPRNPKKEAIEIGERVLVGRLCRPSPRSSPGLCSSLGLVPLLRRRFPRLCQWSLPGGSSITSPSLGCASPSLAPSSSSPPPPPGLLSMSLILSADPTTSHPRLGFLFLSPLELSVSISWLNMGFGSLDGNLERFILSTLSLN